MDHVHSSCDSIMRSIRSSPLNYSVQETAYSLYVTIRKSTRNTNDILSIGAQNKLSENNLHCENELIVLQSRCEILENKNEVLKNELEEAVIEIEEKQNNIECLEAKSDVGQSKLEDAEKRLKEVDATNHHLKVRVENMSDENKSLKSQNNELENEIKTLKIDLKSSKKEVKVQEHESKKKQEALEDTIRNLNEFKIMKNAEEKEFKVKNKKLNKKLKDLEEKKAKIIVEKNMLDRISTNDVKEKETVINEVNKNETEDTENNIANDQSTSSHHPQLNDLPLIPPTTLDQSLNSNTLNLISMEATMWNPLDKESSMNSPTTSPTATALNTSTVDSDPAFHSSTLSTSSALNSSYPITLEHSPLHPTTKESNNAAINKVYDDYEEKVRRKALILVKKKIEKRLKDVEIDGEALAQLEKELLEDLEETIQEKLLEYRNKNITL